MTAATSASRPTLALKSCSSAYTILKAISMHSKTSQRRNGIPPGTLRGQ